MTKPTLSFIGAGTLGRALAKACAASGYRITAIHSHSFNDAQCLAGALPEAEAVRSPSAVTHADICFLTVPDDAIATVCSSVTWPASSSVVHCSGALSLDVLESAAEDGAATGSLHPLQTFARGAAHAGRLAEIAYALEASTPTLHDQLEDLVRALGGRPQWIESAAKPLYHASAAMASNYLVALLGDASKLWESFGLSRNQGLHSLLPLVQGTLDNLQGVGFPDALTGPIARGDVETVRIHLQALTTSQPDIVSAYAAMGKRTIALGLEKGSLSQASADAIGGLLDAATLPEV